MSKQPEILQSVSASVFGTRPWQKHGVISMAVDDAISGGPTVAIPVRVDAVGELRKVQHRAHVCAFRKGYRIQTISNKATKVLYVRAVRPIQGLYHRAGRPSKVAQNALRNLKSLGAGTNRGDESRAASFENSPAPNTKVKQ
jgi:hypothetical protein